MDQNTLKYTKSHEWIEAAGAVRKMGITDFAQDQLGDIVFVEFPEAGKQVEAGQELLVIESCKATASVYAPVGGTVKAVNTPLADAPELVNQSACGEGWLVELEVADPAQADALLDAAAYAQFCESEEH